MYDEVLLTVHGAVAEQVDRATLAQLELQERAHLQEWILAHPGILGPGVQIITSEFGRWQSAGGDPVQDRLDILAVSPDGHLVVAELKRGIAPHSVHMQAVNYAAMVSRLTPKDVAELYCADCARRGKTVDVESALAWLTADCLLTSETIRHPRIALVASDFPPSVTASVVWLSEQGVDISLIRFRPYQLLDGPTVVSFSRLYPIPDVEEFTIVRGAEAEVASVVDSGAAWDEESLRRLAARGNTATLALLDLCAAEDVGYVGVTDVAAHAGVTYAAVRSQLAGLTMLLRNPKNGFAQNKSPIDVEWLPGGVASYHLETDLAEIWRSIER